MFHRADLALIRWQIKILKRAGSTSGHWLEIELDDEKHHWTTSSIEVTTLIGAWDREELEVNMTSIVE